MKRTILLTMALMFLLSLAGGCYDPRDSRQMSKKIIDTQGTEQLTIRSNDHIYLSSTETTTVNPKSLLKFEESRTKAGERKQEYAAHTTISDNSISIDSGFRPESTMHLNIPATYHNDVEIQCYSITVSHYFKGHFFDKLYITSYKPRVYDVHRIEYADDKNLIQGITSYGELNAEEMKLTSFESTISCRKIVAGNAEISTSTGEVLIEDFSGSGSIVSEKGDITVHITEINGDIQIESISGDIRVFIHSSLGNYGVTARSESGAVINAIDVPKAAEESRYHIDIKNISGCIRAAYFDEYPSPQF